MKTFVLAILKEMTGAPTEFQVLPQGKIEVHGDEPAYLDAEAAGKVIAAFKARGNDMVIDYEHQSLADVQSPAAGWVKDLVWKGAEGLWAVVEWTAKAAEYLKSREYRYFSPVMLVIKTDRKVMQLVNVALTNNPAINNLRPIVAKVADSINQKKEDTMIEKIKKLLGLAAEAGEDKIMEGVTLLVNKCTELTGKVKDVVACKEVLDAIGAKEDAGKDEVIQIVASLKAPADVAKTLSLEVAALKQKIAGMEQQDLVTLALKEGKTSPEELDKWGRDLAIKAPDQFKVIVLSRPIGSVIPVTEIIVAKDETGAVSTDIQQEVNRKMGVSEETFKKYNKG
jgi:phage I-like protein